LCGTTFAQHPDHHKKPEPHKWVVRYNELNGKPYHLCQLCGKEEDIYEPPMPQEDFKI
jgi:hypothetical protein